MAKSLSERMAEAARELQAEPDPQGTMDSAVRLAVADVAGADEAGLSIVYAGRRVDTSAATDDSVLRADRLQYETREGPCLDAISEDVLIYSADLARDDRWPTWGPRVVDETDARSIMSIRLFTHDDTVGALNLYARRTEGFDADDREHGLAIAAHIAVAVAAAQQVEQFSTALGNRTVISQAVGILMERYRLTPELAFAVLTRIASNTHTKVRDIAIELCTTGDLPVGPASKPQAPPS